MIRTVLLLSSLICSPLPAVAEDSQAKVLEEIQRLEREYGGHLGVMAKNLDTLETVALNAAERFSTASVIKLPVMAAFFDLVDRKAVNPGTRVVLAQEDKESGSGILQNMDAGANLSLLDVVRLMIVLSDNTATNLVLAQGPYRARDSSGGKMEDDGGFRALVEDVLSTMRKEEVVKSTRLKNVIISAHSGGYRPAAFALERGGLSDRVSGVFLFDALYARQECFAGWLNRTRGRLYAAYTDHLAKEHRQFEDSLTAEARQRVRITRTSLDHDKVIQGFFGDHPNVDIHRCARIPVGGQSVGAYDQKPNALAGQALQHLFVVFV